MDDEDIQPAGMTRRYQLRHDCRVHRFAWVDDGRRIVVPTDDGIVVWRLGDRTPVHFSHDEVKGASVHFSPDGASVAHCAGGSLTVRGVDDQALRWRRDDLAMRRVMMAWSPGAERLAVAGRDSPIVVLDGQNGGTLSVMRHHLDRVRGLAWSHDGLWLASVADDATVAVTGADGKVLWRAESESEVTCVAWSPHDRELATANHAGLQLRVVDGLGVRVHNLSEHLGPVSAIDFSPDGRVVASIARDYSVALMSTTDGRCLARLNTKLRGDIGKHALRVEPRHLAFHPRNAWLAALGDRDTTIDVWSLDIAQMLRSPGHGCLWEYPEAPASSPSLDEMLDTATRGAIYTSARDRARARGQAGVRCFISYAWGDRVHEAWVADLATALTDAGIAAVLDRRHNARIGSSVAEFVDELPRCDFVIVVGTPAYLTKYERRDPTADSIVAAEMHLIANRLIGPRSGREGVLPVLREGDPTTALPPLLRGRTFADFRDESGYLSALLDLVMTLRGIPLEDALFEVARKALR